MLLVCSCKQPQPDAQELASAASSRMVEGDFEGARKLLEQAVQRKPDFAEAWVGLGLVAKRQGDSEATNAAFAEGERLYRLRVASTHTSGDMVNLAYVLLLDGREPEALELMEEGLKRYSEDRFFMKSYEIFKDDDWRKEQSGLPSVSR